MPALFYTLVDTDKGKVTSIHYKPELLTNEDKQGSINVEVVPEPLNNGQAAQLYVTPSTSAVFYEYFNPAPTPTDVAIQEQLKTADQKYKELDLTTAALTDVQNAKTAQIRELYNQTLASGFSATVSGTQYTFGWQSDDITHMNAAQTSVSKGFLLFPILYADVHGMPVSIPDQATLDSIQSIATKFMMAQHQQALNLVGQVKSATTNTAVNAINWSPATY